MNKHIFFILALILLVIPFSYATSDIGSAKQNDCIDLIQTCTTCTYVNVTSITYPNKTTIHVNYEMIKNGLDYSYNYCDTSNLGEYKYFVVGDKDGIVQKEDFTFIITPSGSIQTTAQGISSLAFITILTVIMIVLGYLGWKLMNSETMWAGGVFFLGLGMILLTYNMWLLYEFKLNYTGSSPDAVIPQIIFYIFMTVLSAGGLTALVLLVTKWKELIKKFKNAIKPEDDKDDLY